MSVVRLGELEVGHRERVREILHASDAFTVDEIAVALDLFDEAVGMAGLGTRGSGLGGTSGSPSTAPLAVLPSLEARASSPDYEVIGAFDERDALAGYACFGPTPGTDRTWDLYWIAVHPSAQGAGVGARLLNAVEGSLAARGARLLVVETSSRDGYTATRRFYERRGYGEAVRIREFYAPADDRVIYVKRLTPAATTSHESERGVTR